MSFFKNILDMFGKNENTESGTESKNTVFRSGNDITGDKCLSTEARMLFDDYLVEARAASQSSLQNANIAALKAITEAPAVLQIEILLESVRQQSCRERYDYNNDYYHVQNLNGKLCKRKLLVDEDVLIKLLRLSTVDNRCHPAMKPFSMLIGVAERYAESNEISDKIKSALQSVIDSYGERVLDADTRRLLKRYNFLIEGDANAAFHIEQKEAWGAKAVADLEKLPEVEQSAWSALLKHASTCSGNAPTSKWLNNAKPFFEKINLEQYISCVESWFSLVGAKGTYPPGKNLNGYELPDQNDLLTEESANTLKGIAWICTLNDDERLARALGDAAEACFRKVASHGPRSPKLGNACVGALSNLKSKEAIAQLGRLKTNVKHNSVKATIDKGLGAAANKAGMSVQDLEELNVPDFGFIEIGKFVQDFETHRAEIIIVGSDVHLKWYDSTGKEQKTIPAKVKTGFAAEVKALKKTVDAIEKQITVIRFRIESSLIEQRNWKLKDLKERYFDHPIAATVANRVIWSINGKPTIFHGGEFVDLDNCPVDASDDAHVELWHPITCEPEEVLRWRQWLRGHEITQPFKQAHREIYVLTDAERTTETYSNRFAAHIIRQHQFLQLCQQRGWKYTLQGGWDSHNTPFLELPKWNLTAEWFIDADTNSSEMSESGVFLNCFTDQVRFKRPNGDAVPLTEILPIVFTEVMRDVDLFVGVCSIGNDPDWVDGGHDNHRYWYGYSFGDLSASAETRKLVLQETLPLLKIGTKCHIDGKFLVVKGFIRTYKIHLGSGNILMEPNDQYLCIVPGSAAKGTGSEKIFLPFEGDFVLSVILSKAFMLAEDKKIADQSIAKQIKRGFST